MLHGTTTIVLSTETVLAALQYWFDEKVLSPEMERDQLVESYQVKPEGHYEMLQPQITVVLKCGEVRQGGILDGLSPGMGIVTQGQQP